MVLYLDLFSALGGTRIPNLLIRSQMLCPIELRAQSEPALHLTCEDRHLQAATLPTALEPIPRAILDLSAQYRATAGASRRGSARTKSTAASQLTGPAGNVRLNWAITPAATVILPRGPR